MTRQRIPVYSLRLVKESNSAYDVFNSIKSPSEAVRVINQVLELNEEAEEVFCVIALNSKNKVIAVFEVSRGTLNSSMVHPREVFKRLVLVNSASFMAFHNHPSGVVTPSNDDINATRRLKEAGDLLGIELLDHIIVGDGYCSLKEKGYM